MHMWGDEGVDREGIDSAAAFIGRWLRKWGRIQVTQYKEKFGTVRVYCYFGFSQVHALTHPGYMYSRYPRWLWLLDCQVGRHLVRPLKWVAVPLQKRLYRWRYARAVQRWQHLRAEILDAADWPELLKGL